MLLAGLFVLLGIRSLAHWIRRPFDSVDPVDHALFALFVVGRVGCWFTLAGFFWLSATLRDPSGSGALLQGRAFVDVFRAKYWWYPLPFLTFLVLQFLAGFFLGRRSPKAPRARSEPP
jgi:hypothetical protein